ncbi:MAG: hypothetical protein AAB839_03015 [Patescibacteria group bacterium]
MLDQKDIHNLRGMFGELLRENNEIFGRELKRDIRDEMHALIAASERRVIGEITEFIASSLLPQIDDHDRRIVRIEGRLKIA